MKKIKCTKKLELKLELRSSTEQRGEKTQTSKQMHFPNRTEVGNQTVPGSSRTVQELLASYWSLGVRNYSLCAVAALNCNITKSPSLQCLLAPGKDKDFVFHLNKKCFFSRLFSPETASSQQTNYQYVWGNGDWWSLLLYSGNAAPLCRKVHEDGEYSLPSLIVGCQAQILDGSSESLSVLWQAPGIQVTSKSLPPLLWCVETWEFFRTINN